MNNETDNYKIVDSLGNVFVTYNDYNKADQFWTNSRKRGVEVFIKTNKGKDQK